MRYIRPFQEVTKEDLLLVGGKTANIGEMLRAGFPVPTGFAVTVDAYKAFIECSGIAGKIVDILSKTNVDDTEQLHRSAEEIQQLILRKKIPDDIRKAIEDAYDDFCKKLGREVPVAVRSSATAEDLPTASFAGQQSSFLNVTGKQELVEKVQECWASLFTPRAIFYREKHNIPHSKVFISVAVQQMVQADMAGVMFTAHPTTGEKNKIVVESTWGLGESLVSGKVIPDRFVVDKDTLEVISREISDKKSIMHIRDPRTGKTVSVPVPRDKITARSLTDEQIREISNLGKLIEEHYDFPQDIEWATEKGKVYILQTRPITVFPKLKPTAERRAAEVLVKGIAASPGLGRGLARIILDLASAYEFNQGDVLVTKMTTPDWVPLMRKAASIVTDEGGITCHAAIVSRELGIPCVVGTRNATSVLRSYESEVITVDGSRGVVYSGIYEAPSLSPMEPAIAAPLGQPITATKIYVNLSIPEIAEKVFKESQPDGVGLLRAEHMMLSIGKHPRKLIEEGGEEQMINAFAEGIRKVAEVFYPRPVVYRFLDFKPDEFLGLEGGEIEKELGHVGPNPMLGFRGAFRYRKEPDIFRLECKAIKKVRDEYGLKNVWVMIPFVRTEEDVIETKKIMEKEGLMRGPDFNLWIMVEVPNTIFLIDRFLDLGIDGISFGTNDLTMLILGIDRGDASVADIYDERNIGVLRALSHAIRICRERGVTTSICGQAPSVYPEYCEFLVREGVTSLSVNPDAVITTRRLVASIEQKILLENIISKREGKPLWEPTWSKRPP